MAGNKRKNAESIMSLGVLALVLIACVSLSFKASNFIAGSFTIDGLQICEELDEVSRPVNVENSLPSDSQQACLWFSFSRARRGDSIEVAWYLNGKVIQKEIMRLADAKGIKAFYLLKEDGSPLESGAYSIRISCNGRERAMEDFTVAVSSEDAQTGGGFIWD